MPRGILNNRGEDYIPPLQEAKEKMKGVKFDTSGTAVTRFF